MATAKLYSSAFKSLGNKQIDLDTDALKVMLVTHDYTPDVTHQYKSSVTPEASGTNYTAGGVALANPTVTVTGNVFKFDADDVTITNSTITARYAVIYSTAGGSDAADPLICYVDFGSDVSTTAGTFQIVWNSAGIFTVTV